MNITIPNKFVVVRKIDTSRDYGIYVHGTMIVSDNKDLQKFKVPYEKAITGWKGWTGGYIKAKDLDDIEFDNIPTKGFSLMGKANYCKNGEQYVMHPLGFIFVISLENLIDIIKTCDIKNGVIKDDMFFSDKKVLISTSTGMYKSMVKKEERKEAAKQKASNIDIGSLLICNDGKKYEYCGKFHFYRAYNTNYLENRNCSSLFHVLREQTSGIYIYTDNLVKNSYSLSTVKVPIDPKKVVKECNEQIKHGDSFCDYTNFSVSYSLPLLVAEKKINYEDLYCTYKDTSYSEFALVGSYSVRAPSKFILVEKDSKTYHVIAYTYNGYSRINVSSSISQTSMDSTSVWGYEVTLDEKGKPVFDIDVSKHNGISNYSRTECAWELPEYNRYTKSVKPRLTLLGKLDQITFKIGTLHKEEK